MSNENMWRTYKLRAEAAEARADALAKIMQEIPNAAPYGHIKDKARAALARPRGCADMTDLEITKACAIAMGYGDDGPANKWLAYKVSECAILGRNEKGGHTIFNPLHDDAQCFALIERLEVSVQRAPSGWHAWIQLEPVQAENADLKRAVGECVAQLTAVRG